MLLNLFIISVLNYCYKEIIFNYHYYRDLNNYLYFQKIKKKLKYENNIIKFSNDMVKKRYVVTFDNKNYYNDMFYLILNDNNIELLERFHYKISGVFIHEKMNNIYKKKLIKKIKYINLYLSKINIISYDKIISDIEINCLNTFNTKYKKDNLENIILREYNFIMESKRIDIEVSHNHPVNKFVHFWSSIIMIIYTYPYLLYSLYYDMVISFFIAHIIRQSGHFFYERQDLDLEKLKFGHKNESKKETIFILVLFNSIIYYDENIIPYSDYLFLNIILCVLPHYIDILHKYGIIKGINWIIKITTDPFTDLLDFYKYAFIHPKYFLDIKEM